MRDDAQNNYQLIKSVWNSILLSKKVQLIIYIVLSCISIGKSQNLISNGGFENIDTLHLYFGCESAQPWIGESCDIITNNDYKFYHLNYPGKLLPYEGTNAAGVALICAPFIETLIVKLNEPLVKDRKYKLSFAYFTRSNLPKSFTFQSCFTNEPMRNDLYFMSDSLMKNCMGVVSKSTKTSEWTLFEKEFIAEDSLQNFVLWSNSKIEKDLFIYFYFDDFKLIEIFVEHNTINSK